MIVFLADKAVDDINHEDKRKKRIKRYFIRRINADYERVNIYQERLKENIERHLENKSDQSWNDLKNFIDKEFIPRVEPFKTVTRDLIQIVPVLDNPYLVDKYTLIQDWNRSNNGCRQRSCYLSNA